MVKRPTGRSPWGAPYAVMPARKPDFERLLCEAIKRRVLVQLQYDGRPGTRIYQPAAVFYANSERTQVNVMGLQISNSAKPADAREPRQLEVGKIRQLCLTETAFTPDRLDRALPLYKHGIICPG